MKRTFVFCLIISLILPCLFLSTSAKELKNVSEGKKYTVDICDGTPNYGYADDGSGCGDGIDAIRQRLTDGKVAGTDGGAYGYMGAQQTSKAIYVIDLGKAVNGLIKFNMDMYYGNWGIGESNSVVYAVSTDGVSYTNIGKVLRYDAIAKVDDVWKGHDFTLTLLKGVSARYVKITAEAANFVWSSEIQVFSDGSNEVVTASEVSITEETSSVVSEVSGQEISDSSVASEISAVTAVSAVTDSSAGTVNKETEKSNKTYIYVIVAVAIVAAAGTTGFFIIKRKK